MSTRRPWSLLFLPIAVMVAVSSSAWAQTATSSAIYRLAADSSYETGCFGPCDCAVRQASARGTFTLTRSGSDPLFTYYKITDVNWTVALGSPELRITGSGVYSIGGEFAVQQRLEMDLQVGSDPVQHFDSGPVYGPAPFPTIDITITLNGGQACHDTLIHVDASPVPAGEIHPYQILKNSTFQRGCFPPCACPAGQQQPVSGTFALVDLSATPVFREFAVVDVRWIVGEPNGTTAPIPVSGFGVYRLYSQPLPAQQLGLDLTVDGEPRTHYDSGRVNGSSFPRIDSLISINGGTCFDTVFDLHAAPRATAARLTPESGLN